MKNALDAIPVNYLLAMRFSIGALGLCYTLFSKTHPLNKRVLLGGVATGFFMYAAFATQTYGLMFTTAGKNALITAVYVVLVPLVLWAWRGVKPTRRIMGSAAIMLAGVALLSLQGEGGVNIGDFLTFLCGILYAVHICVVDAFADQDVMHSPACNLPLPPCSPGWGAWPLRPSPPPLPWIWWALWPIAASAPPSWPSP